MYRQYRVTITPHIKSANFDVKVRVKSFHDNGAVVRKTYVPVGFDSGANGRDVLRVPVKGAARDLEAGYRVTIPKDKIIPAGGYLVIAKDIGGSEIVDGPGWRINDTPRATHPDTCSTEVQRYWNGFATQLGDRVPQWCCG